MVFNFVLAVYFIFAILSLTTGILTPVNKRIDINLSSKVLALITNCIIITIFSIALFKQLPISDYMLVSNTILSLFIIDSFIGLYITIITFNQDFVIQTKSLLSYHVISGVVGIVGTLFIWM